MNRPNLSAKRISIDKTNASLIVIVSVTAFVVVFCIVATRALYSQLTYQSRVITEKKKTLKTVEENIAQVEQLNIAYKAFSESSTNVIGGNPKGTGDRDGENPRIILDALPSKYDFPALTTSLDKLVKSGGFSLVAVNGIDDEVNQSANQSAVAPVAVDMPFTLESNVAPSDGKRFLELFERSIRPIQMQKLVITSQESNLKVEMTAKTYYQPEKKMNFTEEVVK